MKICLLYTDYSNQTEKQKELNPNGEKYMLTTRKAIKEALEKNGHQVFLMATAIDMLDKIKDLGVDIVFNMSSGLNFKREIANVVGMLEMIYIPFKGSSLPTQIKCLHKSLTKSIFKDFGIRTADYQVFKTGDEILREDLSFPLIVKPDSEGNSLGITGDSIAYDKEGLYKRVKYVINEYKEKAIVEDFLPGREFTVGILGNTDPEVLPILEIGFPETNTDMFQSEQVKSEDQIIKTCPAKIDKDLEEEIKEIALKAYKALELEDYSRIDIRLDKEGRPSVIEINSMPMLTPGYSDFPYVANVAGYDYDTLINTMAEGIAKKEIKFY